MPISSLLFLLSSWSRSNFSFFLNNKRSGILQRKNSAVGWKRGLGTAPPKVLYLDVRGILAWLDHWLDLP